MKRLVGGFALAALFAGGLAVATPTPVAAQGPPDACQVACREEFVACMQNVQHVRGPGAAAAAAACRVAAVECLKACAAE
jgi:hypothetical protein